MAVLAPRTRRATAWVALLATLATHTAAADALADLGRALFFDPNLSANRTQSCASCHDPARGFADTRPNARGSAVSLGDDGRSLGTRNAPSIAYAALVPPYGIDDAGWLGGLFLDGRAADLAAQAAEPFVNPREMALADHAAVVARVRENPAHVAGLAAHFGADVFADSARAMTAITTAIAAFERAPPFVAFDSRYDRYLAGELELTVDEELGRRVYFSDLVNCMRCHLLDDTRAARREPFSDHRYHNIGVPANPALALDGPDRGLGARADVADPAADGRFRTPTLRNVAVTAPYMHNGVFRDLETAIRFYNQYLVNNAVVGINPETGRAWGEPEVAANVDDELLGQGQPLDDTRVRQLVAFLRALTDRRFEHLLPALATDIETDHAQP
ncbi:MAG: cytochrome-c peroxidase [Gammaproteobacteria bacterium]